MVELICENCNKKFTIPNWVNKKGTRRFCTLYCSNQKPNFTKYNLSKKGKTYDEFYGIEKGKKIVKERLLKTKETINNYSIERKKEISEAKSKAAFKAKVGGYVPGSGRGKGGWYESKIAGRIYCDSTYELAYVAYLDTNNINWVRNKNKFSYIFENKEFKYIPDFYLVDEDYYIEIKGFETERDKAKWKYFPYKLIILKRDDLKKIGLTIK